MNRIILFSSFVILSFVIPAPVARAAVVFSGNVNIPIPLTFDGVYLNVDTGVNTTAYPADWNTAPWINPFFGGVYVANSPTFRSVITGTDQIVNLAAGTTIDANSNFVAGESGSSTHIGNAPDQFTLGTPGYLGFTFPATGGGAHYGWMRVTFENSTAGTIHSYAFEATPNLGIWTGSILSVPEPRRAMLLMGAVLAVVMRRRRPAAQYPSVASLNTYGA